MRAILMIADVRWAPCFFWAALVLTAASAHDGHDHPPAAVKPADAYRPTALPDRVILTWSGDPATLSSEAVTLPARSFDEQRLPFLPVTSWRARGLPLRRQDGDG